MKRGTMILSLKSMGFLLIFLTLNFVSAATVTITDVSEGLKLVSIVGAEDMYSYEINLNISGGAEVTGVEFNNFLASGGATTTSGYSQRGDIVSVYESRLDSSIQGVNGSGALFNVTYTGTVNLSSALFVSNNSAEEENINYEPQIITEPEPEPELELCGDNSCSATETCSTCPADCGSCGVPTPSSGSSGGGGGGGGGSSSTTSAIITEIEIDKTELIVDLILNSNKERVVKVTNHGNFTKEVNLGQIGLEGLVLFKQTIVSIGPGESKEIRIVFVAPAVPGVYAGKILIGGNEIVASVNVNSKLLLFDVSVVVPENNKLLNPSDKLSSQITLIPMGENPRVDVTITYIIKDFEGRTHLTESETVLIEGQRSYEKDFSINSLNPGKYILGVEVVYPEGVATSSSHFEINGLFNVSDLIFWVLIVILAFAIIVSIVVILRYIKHKRSIPRKRK